MKYYPIYLDLRERPCLVIGGGRVAERKTLSLLEAGADVSIVSPELSPKLRELSVAGKITHRSGMFEDRDLTDTFLVIAATNSTEVNSRAARACKQKKILVNVAAPPGESTFIVPSVVDRGELLIAISTSGASPALSKKIRRELEERYGREYELFLQKMLVVRKRLMEEAGDETARRFVLRTLAESDVLDLLQQGNIPEAEHRMAEIAGIESPF